MVSAGLQILGICLAMIGFLGNIVICALPKWKVTAFIGANIVTSQTICEGLWMNCVVQRTGQMHCKVYDSLLRLPQDLQCARALVIIAIIAGVFGVLLCIVGGKCTNFVEDEVFKAKVAIASGVIFIIAGILVLIPVCWVANNIIRDLYNPLLTDSQRRELGESLYIGWASAGLLFLGGGLLCSCRPPSEDVPSNVKFSQARYMSEFADADTFIHLHPPHHQDGSFPSFLPITTRMVPSHTPLGGGCAPAFVFRQEMQSPDPRLASYGRGLRQRTLS